ncbi:MAG TPA: hypothetical protein VL172_06365 [Kofleriaceae bacterium]|nr:hypothetical protein [Kofleriaceae bacterium]
MKRGFPRKWAIRFYIALAAATLAAVVWINLSRKKPEPLSAAERQDLAVTDELSGKRLRHPLLGFSLAYPGPKFFESADAEKKVGFTGDPSTRFYAFTELDSGRMVIVSLSRRPHMSGDGFARAVDSVTQMFTSRTAAGFDAGAAVDVLSKEVDRDGKRAEVHVRVHGLGHLRLRARLDRFAGETDYLLMVIAVSPADDSLAPVVASLST